MNDFPYIMTNSGSKVYFDDPNSTTWKASIDDISHALSRRARFSGHTDQFYSVAEHCVRGSWMAPPALRLPVLLHDAAEAFLPDIPRPIKGMFSIRTKTGTYAFSDYEDLLLMKISSDLGIPFGSMDFDHETVKRIDTILLASEMRDLCKNWDNSEKWSDTMQYPSQINPWSPDLAKLAYYTAFFAYMENPGTVAIPEAALAVFQ